ncbi:MAG: serine/threonine protein kinase [Myxococcaceae bacterium]|nr:MAG: serine/threonine protein kinase [Myxococcaceae bacterium]
MKHCPRCQARYDDASTHCSLDGASLEAPPDPMVGRTLASRYKILRRVGAGGMGQVYRARHVILRHDVALKLLSSELTRDPVMRERFVREAQATNLLKHPNIVDIWDVAEEGNRVFLVMEFLEGESLAQRMQSGPLGVREAVEVAIPVCHALGRAHSLGVVHRDVKPENVFLVRDPSGALRVKVLDFGIVHMRGEVRLTMPGEVFGTPEYLASELARGEPCGPASDLYALGVMLYEMVTGALPFNGTVQQLIDHHARTAPPAIRARMPSAPEALDALVLSLMQKRPAERPRSAAEVLDALASILEQETTAMAPAGRPSVSTPERDGAEETTLPGLRKSVPSSVSIPTLRQRVATFQAAAEAAFPRGEMPEAMREQLRRFHANVERLRVLEEDRRGMMIELTERERRHQRERDELLGELRQILVEHEGVASRAQALETREREAKRDEAEVLRSLALAWDSAGAPPGDPREITVERAVKLEELGALASRWRAVRSVLDGVGSGRTAQQRSASALEERRDAVQATLDALEGESQATSQRLQLRAVSVGAEIATILAALGDEGDAVRAMLRAHPVASGLLRGLEQYGNEA